jgi:predicted amidophosphoribosyltransferase
LKQAWHALWEILLPPVCPLCAKAPPQEGMRLCTACLGGLAPLAKPHCTCCSLPFEAPETVGSTGHRCSQCARTKPPFEGITVYGPFDDTLRTLVHEFKYNSAVTLRPVLEELFLEGLEREFDATHKAGNFDAVIPVPCHRSTLFKRGFDLPALLSRRAAKHWGTKWEPEALIKTRKSEKMAGLGLKHRKTAVRGLYDTNGPVAEKICLVDDVVTSTATVRACARELKRAGAKEVWVAALARTPVAPMRG